MGIANGLFWHGENSLTLGIFVAPAAPGGGLFPRVPGLPDHGLRAGVPALWRWLRSRAWHRAPGTPWTRGRDELHTTDGDAHDVMGCEAIFLGIAVVVLAVAVLAAPSGTTVLGFARGGGGAARLDGGVDNVMIASGS
ncbi:hypothetical protein QJS66_11795 [Kocuria rhizophila]|nr:hypothetical protein QJS66_11795 [Kocuria rhizophila]